MFDQIVTKVLMCLWWSNIPHNFLMRCKNMHFWGGHLTSKLVHIWSFIALNRFYLSFSYKGSKCWKSKCFLLIWTRKQQSQENVPEKRSGRASQLQVMPSLEESWRWFSHKIYKWCFRFCWWSWTDGVMLEKWRAMAS